MAALAASTVNSLFPPNPPTERAMPAKIDISKDGSRICYGSGKCVVVREAKMGGSAEVYKEHQGTVAVARFSPNGQWIASGDNKGKMRVWASKAGGEDERHYIYIYWCTYVFLSRGLF